MELGESESFRISDDHNGCFWNIYSDFNNCRWNQYYDLSFFEILHDGFFVFGFHFSVEESDFPLKFRVEELHFFKFVQNSLPFIKGFAFFNQTRFLEDLLIFIDFI